MLLCLHVQRECTLNVHSWVLLFFRSFRIECVLFAQLELVQCGGDGEAILFLWGPTHNKVITAGDVYFRLDLIDYALQSIMSRSNNLHFFLRNSFLLFLKESTNSPKSLSLHTQLA